MKHDMKLRHEPFSKIKSRAKTIELRLFDEKRSKLSVGDIIVFTDISNEDKLECIVLNLYKYPDFEELFKRHNKTLLGYDEAEKSDSKEMNKYYSEEEIKKYGVVGIEIKVI